MYTPSIVFISPSFRPSATYKFHEGHEGIKLSDVKVSYALSSLTMSNGLLCSSS